MEEVDAVVVLFAVEVELVLVVVVEPGEEILTKYAAAPATTKTTTTTRTVTVREIACRELGPNSNVHDFPRIYLKVDDKFWVMLRSLRGLPVPTTVPLGVEER